MTDDTANKPRHTLQTRLVHGSRPKAGQRRSVNMPVIRASTVLFENVEALRDTRKQRAAGDRTYVYGTYGTPTTHALEDMITDLEGGYRTRLSGSGLAAIAFGLMPFVKPGDHVLVTDAAYEPVRNFVATFLRPYGMEVEFYAADGHDFESRIKPNTKLVYAEVPGSLVYEMLDLRKMTAITKPRGITVAVDNTWGSGILYRPLEMGADVSMIAGTKHIVGHSDVLLGAVTTTKEAWGPVDKMHSAFGININGDDAYLAMRGARTMSARMPINAKNAEILCHWFMQRPEIAQVYWPALPHHKGHDIWKRDFKGACGLFSVEFKAGQPAVDRFINALTLFGIGASWGGYESLVIPTAVPNVRTVTDWSKHGPIVRFSAGLEDPQDLIADIEQALRHIL
jgi:cysteine-S-conjugate beta-lyase